MRQKDSFFDNMSNEFSKVDESPATTNSSKSSIGGTRKKKKSLNSKGGMRRGKNGRSKHHYRGKDTNEIYPPS